jgi:diguanylate cyclase (GGDEF)-like protein
MSLSLRTALKTSLLTTAIFAAVGGYTVYSLQQRDLTAGHTYLSSMGELFSSQMSKRLALEMQRTGKTGTPDRALLTQVARELAPSFPLQISVYTFPLPTNGRPLVSTLEPDQAEALENIIGSKEGATDVFLVAPLGNEYLSFMAPLTLQSGTRADYVALVQAPSRVLMGASQMAVTLLGAGAGAVFLVTFLIGLLLGRGLAGPLRKLTENVRAAEQGQKPKALGMKRKDEIGDLARAIDLLVQGPTEKDVVKQQANTDALTGLANRRSLIEKLNQVCTQGLRGKKTVALMFLDLDGFKPINDNFGHEVGDAVLKVVAQRLAGCVRDEDLIARLGGDEFVIMFPGLTDRDALKQRAALVLERINEPYWVNNSRVTMGVSIGISVAPDDGSDGETLLNASDEAMYAAKKTGKNQFTFYS